MNAGFPAGFSSGFSAGFSDEQEQLRRTVRDFATRELLPEYMHWDRSGVFPTELWRRMGELGLCGARVPVEYDGQEMSAVTTGIVAEEVAIFADHLEALLSAWPEWITACNDLEAAAGISLAKNQLGYRMATLKAEGAVPEMLLQILAKAEGK